jgi:hypothetical protein
VCCDRPTNFSLSTYASNDKLIPKCRHKVLNDKLEFVGIHLERQLISSKCRHRSLNDKLKFVGQPGAELALAAVIGWRLKNGDTVH